MTEGVGCENNLMFSCNWINLKWPDFCLILLLHKGFSFVLMLIIKLDFHKGSVYGITLSHECTIIYIIILTVEWYYQCYTYTFHILCVHIFISVEIVHTVGSVPSVSLILKRLCFAQWINWRVNNWRDLVFNFSFEKQSIKMKKTFFHYFQHIHYFNLEQYEYAVFEPGSGRFTGLASTSKYMQGQLQKAPFTTLWF